MVRKMHLKSARKYGVLFFFVLLFLICCVFPAESAGIDNNNLLIAYNFNQSACPCLQMVYDFKLKNTGSFREVYSFGVDKFAEYANISANPLALEPGESKDIKLHFKLDCGVYGENLVNFYSNARKSGITAKVPLLLNVEKCYDYEILSGELLENDDEKFDKAFSGNSADYSVCAGNNKSIQIMVDNTGYIGNNFNYKLNGPEWGSMYGDVLRLSGYEKETTFLDVYPKLGTEGTYKFVLDVMSQRGDENKQKVITVDVMGCYGLIVEATEEEKICSCIDSDIGFEVMNTGNFAEDVLLSLEGPEFLNLTRDKVSIESGSSGKLKIRAEPGCDVRGEESVKVKAALENENAYAEDVMSLEIIPADRCYHLEIKAESVAALGYDRSQVPVTVSHSGINEADYEIELIAPEWIRTDSNRFKLAPGETFAFNIIAQPDENVSKGSYYGTLNVKAGNVIYRKKIKFRLDEDESVFGRALSFVDFFRYWIYTAVVAIVIIVALSLYFKEKARVWKVRKIIKKAVKNEKKKAPKAEEKDTEKKRRMGFKWLYSVFFVLLVAAIIYALAAYTNYLRTAFRYLADFVIEYFFYIVFGFLLLWIIIVIMNSMEKKK